MSQPNWDQYFLGMIKPISTKSKDPNTKIGCVIVGPDREIRTTGYNSFVRGLRDDVPERLVRPEKYWWTEHAERNAIFNAARVGTPLKDCVIYVPSLPCVECARAIVSVGIRQVVNSEQAVARWVQTATTYKEHFDRMYTMFAECGVVIRSVDFDWE
jgi:dCMP deaminase